MTTFLNLPLDIASNDEPRYDLLDNAGRLLLVGVTARAANHAADQLSELPGWTNGFRIRNDRARRTCRELLWDWRHEGPLELLAYSSDFAAGAGVLVRSHVGRCALEIEEMARRLDQFTEQHQAILLGVMAEHFGYDPIDRLTYLQGELA